jgi:hypothetical protein
MDCIEIVRKTEHVGAPKQNVREALNGTNSVDPNVLITTFGKIHCRSECTVQLFPRWGWYLPATHGNLSTFPSVLK